MKHSKPSALQPQTRPGAVRMSDVARAAGVASVTVSRVINHPDTVAPATRELVQATIRQLGYVPDLTAGSLASARSKIVGAIVPTLSNAWFADTMDGLAAALAPQGYQLMLAQSSYHPREEAGLVDAFLGRRVDAIVLTGVSHERSVRDKLRRLGLPVVETWDLTDDPIDMAVGFSNAGVGAAVAQYLCERGHKRIGFIGADELRARKRLDGLQSRLAELGMAPAEVDLLPPPSTIDAGAQALTRLLERAPRIQAVFCSNDILGVGALLACRQHGWQVPGRIAVVGFSDLAIAAASYPTLTTVQVRPRELGRHAGEVLLRRLQGAARPGRRAQRVMDLGFRIVPRESA
ncbi:LacI family DNA-binding transcriptional regulator [Cupriavidus sp. PET2-C1]